MGSATYFTTEVAIRSKNIDSKYVLEQEIEMYKSIINTATQELLVLASMAIKPADNESLSDFVFNIRKEVNDAVEVITESQDTLTRLYLLDSFLDNGGKPEID